MLRCSVSFAALGCALAAPAIAADTVATTDDAAAAKTATAAPDLPTRPSDANAIESIIVTGDRIDPALIAGSASLLDEEELALFGYSDVNRVLRQVPGVNLQEEDGFGLFPNIGLRGTSVERSSNITLMEDGVLIAPAPYAAPAAYYFPEVGRMNAVEVAKGALAVRYGPRTTGGAINFRSTPIPDRSVAAQLDAFYGEDNQYSVHAFAGGQAGLVSGLIETWQSGSDGFKQLDGGGDTGFQVEDYVGKLRLATPFSFAVPMSLEFKVALTSREANETYLGLTEADFAADPYRRYAASSNDRFESDHDQYMATHRATIGTAELVTVGYYNSFQRNWLKLENLNAGDGRGFVGVSSILANPDTPLNAAALAILRGEQDSAPGALRVRNNNRRYYSAGVQSALTFPLVTGNVSHLVELSARYHQDEEDRLQNYERFQMVGGNLLLSSVDTPGSDANREAKANAIAIYAQDTITVGRLTLTPGFRYENIELTRIDYSTADPTRAAGPTRVREKRLDAFLPALGAVYRLQPQLFLLGSVSRGFAPPDPGSGEAEAERSWNFESGVRYEDGRWSGTLIGFYNDYSNILGDCTVAVGCTAGDIGDQFNGGAVDVLGIEASLSGSFPVGAGVAVPLVAVYTFTQAEFQRSFASDFFGDVAAGDSLPYIPEHQLYLASGIEGDGWSVRLGMNYVGDVRTEPGQGPIPLGERIEDRAVFDLAGHFRITEQISLFGRVDNLFDEVYAAARRPAGLRPGKPRTALAGVRFRF